MVEEKFCRTSCRSMEVRSRNSKTFKERRCNEMRGVRFERGRWANFDLGLIRETEEIIRERMEFLVKIFGNTMVDYMEETPFFAS